MKIAAPLYGSTYRPYNYWRLMNPSPYSPVSSIVRDPWWYSLNNLRPYSSASLPYYRSPYWLRTSYLSPVKSRYLWYTKPLRPFCKWSDQGGSSKEEEENWPNQ